MGSRNLHYSQAPRGFGFRLAFAKPLSGYFLVALTLAFKYKPVTVRNLYKDKTCLLGFKRKSQT